MKHLPQLPPKIGIAEWIKEWIKCRVQISDPRETIHELSADAMRTESNYGETDEIWQKTDSEGPHDDAELLSRFDLLPESQAGS